MIDEESESLVSRASVSTDYNSDEDPYTPIIATKLSSSFDEEHGKSELFSDKPSHSYISLIANAILASPEKRLVLSDIYKYVLERYDYFKKKGSGWRNSIRHNLSLNDCFIKAGRSPNGKGHYWAINTVNYEDFARGDFRRRRVQRRVRRTASSPTYPPYAINYYPFQLHYPRNNEFIAHPGCNILEREFLYSIERKEQHTRLLPRDSVEIKSSISSSKVIHPPKTNRPFDIENLLKDDKIRRRKNNFQAPGIYFGRPYDYIFNKIQN